MSDEKKERIRQIVYSYFVIVTLINVASFVLGSIFRPEERFGYDAFLSPLIYGIISLVPIVLFETKKERTRKQEIIKEILKIIVLEILLIGFGFGFSGLSLSNVKVVIGFALSVLFIYIFVLLITWYLDSRTARQLTDDLKIFQNENEQ